MGNTTPHANGVAEAALTLAGIPSFDSIPSIDDIVDDFFDGTNLDECEDKIWDLNIAYAGQDEHFTSINRSNTTFFCAKLSRMLRKMDGWRKSRRKQPGDEPKGEITPNVRQLLPTLKNVCTRINEHS